MLTATVLVLYSALFTLTKERNKKFAWKIEIKQNVAVCVSHHDRLLLNNVRREALECTLNRSDSVNSNDSIQTISLKMCDHST